MYPTSDTWRTLINDPASVFETRAVIAGVTHGEDELISLTVAQQMFPGKQPGVGGCIAAELDLTMLMPAETVPRMAQIRPYVRAVKGSTVSEWIPQGIFYIDTRETTANNDGLDVFTVHAFDAMLKTEADYPATSHSWPYSDINVVREIAAAIGVGVDPRTAELMDKAYPISLPAGYSMREVLGNIAAMYAGNWIMNYDGDLLLIAVNGIPPETNYLVDSAGDAITFGGDRILV